MFTLERIPTLNENRIEAHVQHDGKRTHIHPLIIVHNHPAFYPNIGLQIPRLLDDDKIAVREVSVEDTDEAIIYSVLYTDPFSDT